MTGEGAERKEVALPAQSFSPTKLRELRENASLTRTALAFGTERSEQTVWLWERGLTTPSVATLEQIAHLLGCDVADFFEVDDG